MTVLTGYQPDPALEDATWQPILSPCGKVIVLRSPDGFLLRHRCIDRRCRIPAHARLSYIDLRLDPPKEVAHVHVPVEVGGMSRQGGHNNGE